MLRVVALAMITALALPSAALACGMRHKPVRVVQQTKAPEQDLEKLLEAIDMAEEPAQAKTEDKPEAKKNPESDKKVDLAIPQS